MDKLPQLKKLILIILSLQISACATNFRQGLQNLEDHNSPKALKFFELDAKIGYRVPALYASQLYIGDYKIPRDLEKSRHYLEMALKSEYERYDQAHDYYIPLIKAYQILEDEKQKDKSLAFTILNYEKYQKYSSSLSLRATCNLVGHGVERNLTKGIELFERAVEHQVWDSSGLYFAWWLSIYPEEEFRNPERALKFALEAMEDDDISDRPVPLDILAATYAINNQFEKAIQTQKKAIDILNIETDMYPYLEKFKPAFDARLESYQKGYAWILSNDDLSRCGFDSIQCIRK